MFVFFLSSIFLNFLFIVNVWGDSNGIWHWAEDVRPGTFGLDERDYEGYYSFIDPVNITRYLIVGETLSVGSDAIVGGNLDIIGSTSGEGQIIGHNGLIITSNGANIVGNSYINGTLDITNKLTVLSGGAEITGDSYIDGQLDISNKLTVLNGGADIAGDSFIDGQLNISDRLTVSSGGANIIGNSYIQGTLDIDGILTTNNRLYVTTSGMDVTGNSNIDGTFYVTGRITGENGLDITGNTNLYGELYVEDRIRGDGNLIINNDAEIGGTLDVSGGITGGNGLIIDGNSNLGGTLDVSGRITGNNNLQISGNTNLGGILDVSGRITGGNGIDINGNSNINGNLGVTGTITGNSNLQLAGNANVNGNMGVTGTITGQGGMDVSGNVIFDDELTVPTLYTDLIVYGDGVIVGQSPPDNPIGESMPNCSQDQFPYFDGLSWGCYDLDDIDVLMPPLENSLWVEEVETVFGVDYDFIKPNTSRNLNIYNDEGNPSQIYIRSQMSNPGNSEALFFKNTFSDSYWFIGHDGSDNELSFVRGEISTAQQHKALSVRTDPNNHDSLNFLVRSEEGSPSNIIVQSLGNAQSSNANLRLRSGSGGSDGWIIQNSAWRENHLTITTEPYSGSGLDELTINPDGFKVGIGVGTTATEKLDVGGKIRMREGNTLTDSPQIVATLGYVNHRLYLIDENEVLGCDDPDGYSVGGEYDPYGPPHDILRHWITCGARYCAFNLGHLSGYVTEISGGNVLLNCWGYCSDSGSGCRVDLREGNLNEDSVNIVTNMYQHILDRDPEYSGLIFWYNQLESFGLPWVISEFYFSEEYNLVNVNLLSMTPDGYVKFLYNRFLNREPEDGGYEYWVQQIENGMSRKDVLSAFINTEEGHNMYLNYRLAGNTPAHLSN